MKSLVISAVNLSQPRHNLVPTGAGLLHHPSLACDRERASRGKTPHARREDETAGLYGRPGKPGASIRVKAVGFLMCWAAIQSSAWH